MSRNCRDRVSASDSIMEISSMFPGFRFSPTDTELICHYLKHKISGSDLGADVIAEVEICKFEPWDLPDKSVIRSDHEWFFFSPNDKKYPNGSQAKRATEVGFWKATGKERAIRSGKHVIGTKRTLVFHIGRAPKGTRTDWIMHEYCLKENKDGKPHDSYVICRIRKKQDFTSKEDTNTESTSHTRLSPQSSAIHPASEVCSDMQQSGTEACEGNSVKSPEDDCFADILKDDIVKLDESSLYENSALSKPIQPLCSFMPRTDHFQGTARRRIRLQRRGARRNHGQILDRVEKNREAIKRKGKMLFSMFPRWLMCTVIAGMLFWYFCSWCCSGEDCYGG